MGTLVLEKIQKRYGETLVVSSIDLTVREGELVSLLGPSGCGKTTTLRMVAGFIQPTSGRISIGAREVTKAPPYARNAGMVFQAYALFPHMNVANNVAFGLEMRKVGRAERDQRVLEILRLVRLEHLAERFPRQLSGGQQQRVALARAMVVNPAVFLLDEPLSNLDAKLRAEVRSEIRSLQQRLGLTTLLVTHDQEEALTMSDRLVVMESGRVRQVGTATELYETPADAFVADFVGRCNLVPGQMEPGGFRTTGGDLLPCGPAPTVKEPLVLALRPEHVVFSASPEPQALPVTVTEIAYLGAQTEYRLDLNGVSITAIRPTPQASDPMRALRIADRIGINWKAENARPLPADAACRGDWT